MVTESNEGHYPNFNVMDQKNHWDAHTREVVEKRLHVKQQEHPRALTKEQSYALFELCTVLLDDKRQSVISFVVHHFDKKLKSDIGEAQRKKGVPEEATLIRDGLTLLDDACIQRYHTKFAEIVNEETKKQVVLDLMAGTLMMQSKETSVPTKDFIKKILNEAVSAYYSHPVIWSEIGYAGPAYPRGYVRTEMGLTDPWEARQNG
jgi:hypothetical protein